MKNVYFCRKLIDMNIKRDILNDLDRWKNSSAFKQYLVDSGLLRTKFNLAPTAMEYRKKYQPELAIRFSLKNVEQNDDLLNLPLYLTDCTKKLIKYNT
jgi:hypothetical protein